MSKMIDRTGEININNNGTSMKIIKYINNKKVLVEFQDEFKYKTYVKYTAFQNGSVRNPYDRVVSGIGYFGEGVSYKEAKDAYHIWYDMIRRCYNNDEKFKWYWDCSVCDDWHNFQNFVDWFNINYYSVPGETMHLDKDIICKGNRIYSPETCVFVPVRINEIFTSKLNKSNDLPVGCNYNHGKIQVTCRTDYAQHVIGRFDKEDKLGAFKAYKEFKESYIKQLAEEYAYIIPDNLYQAMITYEVEIDD